jgi:hypothetical protein
MSAVYIILVLYSELPMPLIEKYIYGITATPNKEIHKTALEQLKR